MNDNQAIGSPGGKCHISPKAVINRLGQQYQGERDERVKQQLLIRMREVLKFLDSSDRSILIQRACGK